MELEMSLLLLVLILTGSPFHLSAPLKANAFFPSSVLTWGTWMPLQETDLVIKKIKINLLRNLFNNMDLWTIWPHLLGFTVMRQPFFSFYNITVYWYRSIIHCVALWDFILALWLQFAGCRRPHLIICLIKNLLVPHTLLAYYVYHSPLLAAVPSTTAAFPFVSEHLLYSKAWAETLTLESPILSPIQLFTLA